MLNTDFIEDRCNERMNSDTYNIKDFNLTLETKNNLLYNCKFIMTDLTCENSNMDIVYNYLHRVHRRFDMYNDIICR